MTITEVKIRKTEADEHTKAIAMVVIDGVFIVDDIKIINTKSSNLSVQFPLNKFKQSMAFPNNEKTRIHIEQLIMDKYRAS